MRETHGFHSPEEFEHLVPISKGGAAMISAIVKVGDPILRRKAELVDIGMDIPCSDSTEALIHCLWNTLDHVNAIGLAAPQIGLALRVAVVQTDGYNVVLVNPEILERSGEQTADEGCLSIPDVVLPIRRAAKIKVRAYLDTFECEGMLARAIQHEIDHLDGILITDRAAEQLREFHKAKEAT